MNLNTITIHAFIQELLKVAGLDHRVVIRRDHDSEDVVSLNIAEIDHDIDFNEVDVVTLQYGDTDKKMTVRDVVSKLVTILHNEDRRSHRQIRIVNATGDPDYCYVRDIREVANAVIVNVEGSLTRDTAIKYEIAMKRNGGLNVVASFSCIKDVIAFFKDRMQVNDMDFNSILIPETVNGVKCSPYDFKLASGDLIYYVIASDENQSALEKEARKQIPKGDGKNRWW